MGKGERVKNICLVGQGGVGKTMLAEAMLHLTGKTSRLGGHAGTKPTLDSDVEEEKRGFSISTSIAPITYKDMRLNVLDAPCYPDFIGDAYTAMSVCETALFVVDAQTGAGAITTKLWYAAEDLSLSRAIFVNRIDRTEQSYDYTQTVSDLKDLFGTRLGAVTLPWGTGSKMQGIIDIVNMKARHLENGKPVAQDIPEDMLDAANAARDALCELVVEADDELMLQYLEGGQITQEELESLLHKAIIERIFVPVFCGSSVKEEGIITLLEDIVTYFPTASDFGAVPLVNGEALNIDEDDKRPVVFVFKTLPDRSMGNLSFVKVLAGSIEPGCELLCARTKKPERLSHLYLMCGHETQDQKVVRAGDICVVPKLEAKVGDTLSVTGKVEASAFRFPNSLYKTAIEVNDRSKESKVISFIDRICNADPTMRIEHNMETGQTVITAIGEAQVSVLLDRLADQTGIEVDIVPLRIPYRETIRRTALAQGRYKKQTGGAGQYGDCWLRLEPNPGGGYEFIDEVVGGHIPRNYIPAVDKGVQETMQEGILAGYPVIDVKCAVTDGSYHSVDSNEMAFKTAARLGFQKAAEQADPVILEPMAFMEITVPEDYAGAIMGDIPASRGRVEGMNVNERGATVIQATVPYAEVVDYALRLRSLSRGTGEFTLEISGYEQVPYEIQQKLAQAYAQKKAQGR